MGRLLLLLTVSVLLLSIIPIVYQINSSMVVAAFGVANDLGSVQQYVTSTCSPGMVAVPCSTTPGPSGAVYTDWAVLSVSMSPSSPHVGDSVTFSMVVSALSSTGPFPQEFTAACSIDGASCGVWTITYPGPLNTPYTVSMQTPWTATAGTHTLEWAALTIPLGLNPNPSNNHLSQTFTVASQASFDFSILATPATQSVAPGGSTSFAVNVGLVSGAAQSVSLSLSGQPGGVTASFTPNNGTPSFGSTLSVTASSSAAPGNYTLTITGSGGGQTHSTNVLLGIIVAVTSSSASVSSSSSASAVSSSVPTSGLVTPITAGLIGIVGIIAGIGVGYGVSKLRSTGSPGSTPSTPTNPPGSTSGPQGPNNPPEPSEPAMDCATLQQIMNNLNGLAHVFLNSEQALEQSIQQATQQLASVNQQISPSGIPAQIASLVKQIKGLTDMQNTMNTEANILLAAGDPGGAGSALSAAAKGLGSAIGQLQGQETSLQKTLTTDQGLAKSLQQSIASWNSQIAAAQSQAVALTNQWNQLNAIWLANCVNPPLEDGASASDGGGGNLKSSPGPKKTM